jgi:hypothetical protein
MLLYILTIFFFFSKSQNHALSIHRNVDRYPNKILRDAETMMIRNSVIVRLYLSTEKLQKKYDPKEVKDITSKPNYMIVFGHDQFSDPDTDKLESIAKHVRDGMDIMKNMPV